MSAEESERSRLPFEPNKKRQKPAKTQSKSAAQPQESGKQADKKLTYTKQEMAIPQVVSQRMIRRVAGFCGVPTALGISVLVVSYLLAIYSGHPTSSHRRVIGEHGTIWFGGLRHNLWRSLCLLG